MNESASPHRHRGLRDARLREVPRVRRQYGDPPRRWFSGPTADLYVWSDGDDILGFEYCYDRARDEHAVRWRAGQGFTHYRIDDGESSVFDNSVPIARPAERFEPAAIALDFEMLGCTIDPRVYRFVLRELYRQI